MVDTTLTITRVYGGYNSDLDGFISQQTSPRGPPCTHDWPVPQDLPQTSDNAGIYPGHWRKEADFFLTG